MPRPINNAKSASAGYASNAQDQTTTTATLAGNVPYTFIAESLGRTGLSVTPFFLDALAQKNTRNDLDTLKAQGRFQNAGIGRGNASQVEAQVRKNELCWIDRLAPTAAQSELWLKLDLLKQAFNRTLFLGLNDFEGHYTSYASGGFYKRHLDSFSKNPTRVVSIIIYLNNRWSAPDGGELRVYQEHETHTDVKPEGGTLACFMSRESEHEVLESHANRYSFTGWFKNKP